MALLLSGQSHFPPLINSLFICLTGSCCQARLFCVCLSGMCASMCMCVFVRIEYASVERASPPAFVLVIVNIAQFLPFQRWKPC